MAQDMGGEAGFRWQVRVYYEDTDAGGVVYHANYLRYMERARTERLRALGFELDALREQEDLLFVVRSMELDFFKPARFNEALWVTADVEQVKSASLMFKQAVLREDGEVLCAARVKVACLAAGAFRPKAMPEFIVRLLRDSARTSLS